MLHFIEEYLKLTEKVESPESYLWWGAVSCLSAVLRDNIWILKPNRSSRIYPNMYILLIGDSAVVRKSTPFDVNENLIRGENGVKNTKVMAGAATIQAVLKVLASTETGKPKGGSGLILAKEAAGFFVDDSQTIPNLTNLYDYHPNYDKHVVTYEIPPIKNVCLSMFAGTNETMMQKLIDQTAREGGLLGRCIVVHETKRRHKHSGYEPDELPKDESIWKPLQIFLQKLSTIHGPALFTPEAAKRMNDWYHAYDLEEYYTKTGFEGRLQQHIEKLTLCLSAAKEGFSGIIELNELDEAIRICSDLLPIYKQMTVASGISKNAQINQKVIYALLAAENFSLPLMKIRHMTCNDATREQLDEVLNDLVAAESIEERSIKFSPGYRLTKSFIDQLSGPNSNNNHHGSE